MTAANELSSFIRFHPSHHALSPSPSPSVFSVEEGSGVEGSGGGGDPAVDPTRSASPQQNRR
eukprot:13310-Pelagococcus_subviridis.AAC.1